MPLRAKEVVAFVYASSNREIFSVPLKRHEVEGSAGRFCSFSRTIRAALAAAPRFVSLRRTCLELLDEAYPPNAEGAEASKAVRNVADAFGRGVVEERLEALEKRIKGLEKHRKEGKGRSGWWG